MRSLVVLLASGCYHPESFAPCTATCDFETAGSAAPCPGGLQCVAGGRCADPGATCGPNGEIDAMPDAPPCAGTLVGKDLLSVCLGPNLTTTRLLTGMIDTDHDPRCNELVVDADPSLCTIAGTGLTIVGNVVAMGSRPLVLAATETIQITMSIDVSSHGSMLGAGGNWSGCDVSQIDGNANGGGAGGSFQGQGGGSFATVVMNAGMPAPMLPPGVHGGCAGGRNGSSPGGAGGGAIYFAAPNVVVNADVYAFGGGGTGGSPNSGGRGGGAGGFIGLDADTVSIGNGLAIVASGGGGGGGGGDGGAAAPGLDGREPTAAGSWVGMFGAGGGGPAGGGGDGGAGSPGGTIYTGKDGSAGLSELAGAGGGGGGAGYVRVRHGTNYSRGTGTTITPDPSL